MKKLIFNERFLIEKMKWKFKPSLAANKEYNIIDTIEFEDKFHYQILDDDDRMNYIPVNEEHKLYEIKET